VSTLISGSPSPKAILAGRTISGPASARLTIDGQPYINFYGSGYLALSGVPVIRAAVQSALQGGTPFSQHLPAALGAVDPMFRDVERASAVACGTGASVYFASGYLIGTIGLASLEWPFDVVLIDELAHYSLRDAVKLSGLPTSLFAHCDADSVRDLLRHNVRAKQRPLVVTDGVFATTGRIPPLGAYASVLAPYEGRLFVDESHGFGVVGGKGRGAAEYCGVEYIASTGATLSKAFCAQGAIVACSSVSAERLRALPPIRGASAGSPLSAAAATASLQYVTEHPDLKETVHEMTDYLRSRLRSLGLSILDSPAPIVSFQAGTQADMLALQRRAFDRGIHIFYSTYIGSGSEGVIRCAVFRDHSKQDIDALIDALA
jgi:8-amino-7-oxononanoate synthase